MNKETQEMNKETQEVKQETQDKTQQDKAESIKQEIQREWKLIRVETETRRACERMKVLSSHMEGVGMDLAPYRHTAPPEVEEAYRALGKAFVEAIRAEAKALISLK